MTSKKHNLYSGLVAYQQHMEQITSDAKWMEADLAPLVQLAQEIANEPDPIAVADQPAKIHIPAGVNPETDKICPIMGPVNVTGVQNGKRTMHTMHVPCKRVACQMWNGTDCSLANPHAALINMAIAQVEGAAESVTTSGVSEEEQILSENAEMGEAGTEP